MCVPRSPQLTLQADAGAVAARQSAQLAALVDSSQRFTVEVNAKLDEVLEGLGGVATTIEDLQGRLEAKGREIMDAALKGVAVCGSGRFCACVRAYGCSSVCLWMR